MAVQRHRIMRQVLEIRGCPAGSENRLRAQMRSTFFERLLPQLEQICSESSEAGQLDRVDALVIDLGTVPLAGFDGEMAERFGPAFRKGLEASRRRASPASAELELFSYFVRNGTVPWWADRSDESLLATNLTALIAEAPQRLRSVLHAFRDDEPAWRRIARSYRHDLLDALIAALMPSMIAAHPRVLVELGTLVEASSAARGRAPRATALAWREESLRVATLSAASSTDATAYVDTVARRVARRLGTTYAALRAGGATALTDARQAIVPAAKAASPDAHEPVARAAVPVNDDTSAHPSMPHSRIDALFTDADEVYVENAGLVLLWPFLERFFGRLELLTERRFIDDAAAHRAAGLLQYLASGVDDELSEFMLPLNKLLCGIEIDAVFDFAPPMTPEEIDACDALLAAVIHQASVLNDMSLAGFRGSFLLRKGQLSARDGHFLLRIERAGYDIVLDRIPWSAAVVKLPWMPVMIQVEW